jgi:hypothetical protein
MKSDDISSSPGNSEIVDIIQKEGRDIPEIYVKCLIFRIIPRRCTARKLLQSDSKYYTVRCHFQRLLSNKLQNIHTVAI